MAFLRFFSGSLPVYYLKERRYSPGKEKGRGEKGKKEEEAGAGAGKSGFVKSLYSFMRICYNSTECTFWSSFFITETAKKGS